jgi:GAF domain-containing protein
VDFETSSYHHGMLLEPMLSRLSQARDVDSALEVGLHDFVALHGAEMGDVQLVGQDGCLVIVAARQVGREFLETFRRVSLQSGSACGRAARDGKAVFIPDVAIDPEYAPYSAFAAAVPFKAVLSCPMFGPDGKVLGMISALSSQRFVPTLLELDAASAYSAALARRILQLLHSQNVAEFAERKSAELLEATPWRNPPTFGKRTPE